MLDMLSDIDLQRSVEINFQIPWDMTVNSFKANTELELFEKMVEAAVIAVQSWKW